MEMIIDDEIVHQLASNFKQAIDLLNEVSSSLLCEMRVVGLEHKVFVDLRALLYEESSNPFDLGVPLEELSVF